MLKTSIKRTEYCVSRDDKDIFKGSLDFVFSQMFAEIVSRGRQLSTNKMPDLHPPSKKVEGSMLLKKRIWWRHVWIS